ncbi:MAG: GNAT family N-acetyltransferase [Deltaproteobacteria bacterium]|jgi:ribosomal protein S18 acetylase RimI-like enzyme|nr:GNAT family N-acetyltransferase [Deltaproteobacteria bacterium]
MADDRLRLLTPEDLPGILSIEKASFQDARWTVDDFLAEMERPFSFVLGLFPPARTLPAGFAPPPVPELSGPALRRLPASAPGAPRGTPARPRAPFPPKPLGAFAAFWILYGETHLMHLAVAPERRREGLGKAVLRAVLGFSVARGSGKVLLEASENNPAALALYRSEGFRVVGRRKGYYESGRADALSMTLDLPPAPCGG